MEIKLYEVKLTRAWSHEKGGKSFCLPATSPESAIEQVLAVEPYYNPEWGVTVCGVYNGKRVPVWGTTKGEAQQ